MTSAVLHLLLSADEASLDCNFGYVIDKIAIQNLSIDKRKYFVFECDSY